MNEHLCGKVVLITGGGSGIGRATAMRFAEAHAKVIVADRDEKSAVQVAQEIMSKGGEAASTTCDVTDAADVEAMVRFAAHRFGGLDVAFNNAGVGGTKNIPTHKLELSEWDKILAVNLTSVFLCMRAEIGFMVKHGGGLVINTSSIAGLRAAVNSGVAYAASKHGVVGLTKTAAEEYADRNVRVNAICPGGVATPLLEKTIGAASFAAAKEAALLATAEDVADVVLLLASPEAARFNGVALSLEGGRAQWPVDNV